MMPIPLTRLHTSRVYLLRVGGGVQSRHRSACERQQKGQFDVTLLRRKKPTVPALPVMGLTCASMGTLDMS